MNEKIDLIDDLIRKVSRIQSPSYREFNEAYEKTKLYIENFSISKKGDLLIKLQLTRASRLKKNRPKRALTNKKRKDNRIHYQVNLDLLLTQKMYSIIDILKLLKDEQEVGMIEGYQVDIKKTSKKFKYVNDLEIREEIINRYLQIFKLASLGMYKLGLILMGSILEQLLTTYYNISAKTSDLINRAGNDNLISKSDKAFLVMLNHMRNYIHIQEYLKSKDEIDESRFKGSREIFESLLKKFEKLFNEKY
ncbi:MAG: hypothetical protein ACFFDF_05780 [Candidatus Odinarchaeota archaeon]